MGKNKIILLICILLATSLAVVFFDLVKLDNLQIQDRQDKKINNVSLEDRGIFFESLEKYPINKNKIKNNIFAGISPHHLLAADLIAELFSVALSNQPKTVLIIGPNHNELGDALMICSDYSWDTDLGIIESDMEMINILLESDFIKLDNEIVKNDHACFNLLPFIKHYSPNSKVVPILMSRKIDIEHSLEFFNFLMNYINDDVVIISSVDFSHYLDGEIAQVKDLETISAIQNSDYGAIFKMTNDNLDCPSCVAIPMMMKDYLENSKIKILKNTNSGIMHNNLNVETTSYVTAVFFGGDKQEAKEEQEKILIEPTAIKFLFFGDLMFDRHVGDIIDKKGFDYLFENIAGKEKEFFQGCDIISANLEGAVTDDGAHYDPKMAYDFAFAPKIIANLKNYNFNFSTIANNHIFDQGEQGIIETRKNLDDLGFSYSGCRDRKTGDCSFKILNIAGKKIGMASFSMVYGILSEAEVEKIITNLESKTNAVIVNMHWGKEYSRDYDAVQKTFARKLIDFGADLIIGHHPHVVQGVEEYKGKYIFYSLGNFIFDQYFSKDTQEGLAVKAVLQNNNFEFTLFPFLSKKSQVELMQGEAKKKFLDDFLLRSDVGVEAAENMKFGLIKDNHSPAQ